MSDWEKLKKIEQWQPARFSIPKKIEVGDVVLLASAYYYVRIGRVVAIKRDRLADIETRGEIQTIPLRRMFSASRARRDELGEYSTIEHDAQIFDLEGTYQRALEIERTKMRERLDQLVATLAALDPVESMDLIISIEELMNDHEPG